MMQARKKQDVQVADLLAGDRFLFLGLLLRPNMRCSEPSHLDPVAIHASRRRGGGMNIGPKKPRGASLILLALGMFCATFAATCRAGESNAVENIRLSLRKEGFKIDLSEFDFSVPKDVQVRSAAVCTDGKVNPQRPVSFLEDYELIRNRFSGGTGTRASRL